MAVLYYNFPVAGIAITKVVGYYLNEDLSNSGEFTVRDVIYADYTSIQDPSVATLFLSADIFPLTFVTSFDNQQIKLFGGYPPAHKFGSLTYNHYGNYGDQDFISFEKQSYKGKETIVFPEGFDFPPDMSALPLPEQYEYIFRSTDSQYQWTGVQLSGHPSLVSIAYNLNPSVIANIGFFYVCYANFVETDPPANILVVGV